MNKKKVESKLTKAKKKLVKAESKVAKLQAKLAGNGKAAAPKASAPRASKNGKGTGVKEKAKPGPASKKSDDKSSGPAS